MNGRTLGFLFAGLVVAASACAQGQHQGPVVNTPPLGGSPAEMAADVVAQWRRRRLV